MGSELKNFTLHPFGRGSLTTGSQYSTTFDSTTAAYEAVETITVYRPMGSKIEEIEMSLIGSVSASGTTAGVKYKWQGSDDNTSWDDLHTEITRAGDATTFADTSTVTGRWNLAGGTNFKGANPFYMRMVIQRGTTSDIVSGKTKNSSYIVVYYRDY